MGLLEANRENMRREAMMRKVEQVQSEPIGGEANATTDKAIENAENAIEKDSDKDPFGIQTLSNQKVVLDVVKMYKSRGMDEEANDELNQIKNRIKDMIDNGKLGKADGTEKGRLIIDDISTGLSEVTDGSMSVHTIYEEHLAEKESQKAAESEEAGTA